MIRILPLTTLLLFITITGKAQSSKEGKVVMTDTTLTVQEDQYLNNQAEALLNHVDEVLSGYAPGWPEPPSRRSALLLLDGVLHDVYAPNRIPVQLFYKERIRKAVEEIEQTEVTDGARIWKFYDHGFVIRTGTVTLGFDLIRGESSHAEGFPIGKEYMERLIKQCDVLFISHLHDDHAEEWVARSFIDNGKPVVAPPEVWKDRPIYNSITHPDRIPHTIQPLVVQGGKQKLKVVIYPGHQGASMENNVSLIITPEGLTFAHMGDQSNSGDFVWIDEVGKNYDVDVLMPNCWTTDIVRVAKGFNPALIITGHENELGHTIDHREPYWLTYRRREGSDRFGGSRDVGYDTPLILMTWGESFHFRKGNF